MVYTWANSAYFVSNGLESLNIFFLKILIFYVLFSKPSHKFKSVQVKAKFKFTLSRTQVRIRVQVHVLKRWLLQILPGLDNHKDQISTFTEKWEFQTNPNRRFNNSLEAFLKQSKFVQRNVEAWFPFLEMSKLATRNVTCPYMAT